MKKIYNILAFALAVMASASCAKDENPKGHLQPGKTEGLVQMTFTASMDGLDTKASLGTDLSTSWAVDDSIAVYDGIEARVFKVTSISTETGIATFEGEAKDTTAYYAVYPYTAFSSVVDSVVTVKIPSSQSLAEGEILDPAALVSTAFTANPRVPMSFKNVISLAKVTVAEGAVKVKIFANAAAGTTPYIAGTTSVAITADGIETPVCAGTNTSIALTMDEGAPFAAGTYYIAVAPSTLPAGMYVVENTPDAIYKLSTDKELRFARNAGLNLGNIATNAKTQVVPFTLNSVADYLAFSENAGLYLETDVLKIGADLDFQGAEIKTHTARYYGSIDGQKHRIYNYVIKSGEGTQNTGDAGVFGRIGKGNASYPFYIKDLAFGTKDYNFETGEGTYDGVSKVTFKSVNDGNNTYYYPGSIAYVYAYATCENLVNFTPVEITAACTSPHRAAPLLGTVKSNVTIRNCKNYGDISDATATCEKNPTVGGISGALDGDNCIVEGCVNYGNVTVTGSTLQDFAGVVAYTNYAATYKDCINYGNVNYDCAILKAICVGGITSRMTKTDNVIENCKNEGKITVNAGTGAFDVFVGGITSRFYGGNATNCDNSGEVNVTTNNSGKSSYVGGCFGNSPGAATIKDCDNSGKVALTAYTASKAYVAGVDANPASSAQNLINCHTSGEVTIAGTPSSNAYIAGVAAYSNIAVNLTNCSNSGTIYPVGNLNKNTYFGGIAGQIAKTASVIDGCENTGLLNCGSADQTTVATIAVVGGIAATTIGTIKNSVNKGEIRFQPNESNPNRTYLGGIIGANTTPAALENCRNEGPINIGQVSFSAYSYVGGISGTVNMTGSVKNCSNVGNITSLATTDKDVSMQLYLGGLFGVAVADKTPCPSITGCSVNCTVTTHANTAAYAGMVLGRNAYTTDWTLASDADPVKIKGTLNGTDVSADNAAALAFGSGNSLDQSGVHATVKAVYDASL